MKTEEFKKRLLVIQKQYYEGRWENVKHLIDGLFDEYDSSKHSKQLEAMIADCEKIAVTIADSKVRASEPAMRRICQALAMMWR